VTIEHEASPVVTVELRFAVDATEAPLAYPDDDEHLAVELAGPALFATLVVPVGEARTWAGELFAAVAVAHREATGAPTPSPTTSSPTSPQPTATTPGPAYWSKATASNRLVSASISPSTSPAIACPPRSCAPASSNTSTPGSTWPASWCPKARRWPAACRERLSVANPQAASAGRRGGRTTERSEASACRASTGPTSGRGRGDRREGSNTIATRGLPTPTRPPRPPMGGEVTRAGERPVSHSETHPSRRRRRGRSIGPQLTVPRCALRLTSVWSPSGCPTSRRCRPGVPIRDGVHQRR